MLGRYIQQMLPSILNQQALLHLLVVNIAAAPNTVLQPSWVTTRTLTAR
jgi:hypothetical protein